MPVHNWTRVSAGTFHDFHTAWIAELRKVLNSGLLPEGYYAQAEQAAGEISPDVLTLKSANGTKAHRDVPPSNTTAVADRPPRVSITVTADEREVYALKRRRLVIRHASGDEMIAIIEVLSPGNKASKAPFARLLNKLASALLEGIHLLLIDVFPPGSLDPEGIHGALWAEFSSQLYDHPPDKPLTLAAYAGGVAPTAYVEPIAVDQRLPDMPLFLEEDVYLNVPLESTYMEAYRGVPARWRAVIEGREPS